jgi:hypothetical protein
MSENDSSRQGERRLAQLAAEWHPEAFAAELPESWAGHDVDMVSSVGSALRCEGLGVRSFE